MQAWFFLIFSIIFPFFFLSSILYLIFLMIKCMKIMINDIQSLALVLKEKEEHFPPSEVLTKNGDDEELLKHEKEGESFQW